MDPILRLNEFFVEGGKQSQSHVLLQIAEPSTDAEVKKGYFFALAEINNAETVYLTRLQELIDRAENEYYELEEEPGKNNFETVLEKMNEEAFSLEKATGELHCIVGVIKDPDIIFSYFGKPHLLLFYHTKTGSYQRMDLIENNQEEAGATENNQLFSQIIQGKLTANDFLFAGTPHIVDFFSYDRLEKIIIARPALQSAQHLERVLGEIKNGFSFGGLIINLHIPEISAEEIKKPKPVIKKQSAESSLHNLFDREQNTTNTLAPSIFPKLAKNNRQTDAATSTNPSPNRPQAQINSSHISARQGRVAARQNSDKWLEVTRGIGGVLVMVGKFIASIFYFFYSIVYAFFRTLILCVFVLFNYQKRRKAIMDDWRRTWHSYRENFNNISLLTKIMLTLSILLIIGFVVSIGYIRHRQAIVEQELSFTRAVALIRSKKDVIESNLIYQNQTSALTDYQNAEAAIAALPCSGSKEHQTICTSLSSDFKLIETRLRKVTEVTPSVVADWKDFIGTAADFRLIKINKKTIGYSPNTSTLILYDPDTQNTRAITTYTTITGFSDAAAPKENDYVLFVYNKNQLMQLNPDDMTTKLIDISFPLTKNTIDGLVIYNRRLYTVDSTNNDLFRHDAIKTGFGQGKEWLKDKNTSLTDARDLAIDGDLFVSKDNGSIAKLTSGQTQPFVVGGLDPVFSAAPKLWTYNDTIYLYAFDSKNNRLVVLTKDGTLVAQLTSSLFKSPTGFAVDAPAKTVFIMDGSKLYKFTWPL